jgi:hypothetical protein
MVPSKKAKESAAIVAEIPQTYPRDDTLPKCYLKDQLRIKRNTSKSKTPILRWKSDSELRNLAATKATQTWLYEIISENKNILQRSWMVTGKHKKLILYYWNINFLAFMELHVSVTYDTK